MLEHVKDQLAEEAKHTAQTAAIGLGGFLCLIVGTVFLSIAGWLFLMTVTTALNASLILGLFFFGIGLILFVTISMRSRARKRERRRKMVRAQAAQQNEAGGIGAIINAFLSGLNEGRRARF